MSIILFLIGNKYLRWLGVLLIIVLAYFGWRAYERGVGARKIIEQAKKAVADHETKTADQVRKADRSLADPAARDSVRKRFSRD